MLNLSSTLQSAYITTVFHIAGWSSCSYFRRACDVANALKLLYSDHFDCKVHEFDCQEAYRSWLTEMNPQFNVSFGSESKASAHISSPFVWSSKSGYIGGCDALLDFIRQGLNLRSMGSNTVSKSLGPVSIDEILDYDYDLVVIGGGSGGLACSKEAAKFGKKVCVLDYVKPSPQGTTWGIGGTCVNVGCIPKKLMHQSSIIGEILHKDAGVYGWNVSNSKFEWTHLVDSINNYVKSLNFKYKVDLRDKKVKYENFLGSFVDKHTIELSNPKKGTKILKAKHIVISVGGRPKQLTCPGGELAITSDDIFWRKTPPGKTLVVGASYVALECAGFLRGMGYDVTVMVRSILLRGFDQDIANKIGEFMEEESKISFIRGCVPLSITKLDGGKLQVKWKGSDGLVQEGVFDTVLNATGRYPDVEKLQLENAGVLLNDRTGKILVNQEQTSTPNIFALGDVIDAPELTPVAIKAGRLLARRLYAQDNIYMDYEKICTAVFTPLEYGCCGLSEEASIEKLGAENVEVYHQNFAPLEWSLSHERIAAEKCYCKVVCDKSHNQHVVGFHYLGPNAGEVTQAIGLAMKLGFTYDEISSLVGIHPTTAEVFTTLEVTKSSGADAAAGGC